jgi:hypothetical protein
MSIEKNAAIEPGVTPQGDSSDRLDRQQTPAPPRNLEKGASATDVHPTAAELREQLADTPTKRLADKAAERLP